MKENQPIKTLLQAAETILFFIEKNGEPVDGFRFRERAINLSKAVAQFKQSESQQPGGLSVIKKVLNHFDKDEPPKRSYTSRYIHKIINKFSEEKEDSSPVVAEGNKIYTSTEVENMIKKTLVTTLEGFYKWLKDDTVIVYKGTKDKVPGTEINIIDNAKSPTDYIYPILKEDGIIFTPTTQKPTT